MHFHEFPVAISLHSQVGVVCQSLEEEEEDLFAK